MTVLVGDIHGGFETLQKFIYQAKDTVIQLGDLGIGFKGYKTNLAWHFDMDQPFQIPYLSNFEYDKRKFVFIRGNHDNPDMCRKHKNYLGEWGVFKKIFYISGAWSIDRAWRKEGLDWWADEELTMEQSYKALDMYLLTKPEIVISHDCPTSILKMLHSEIIETRTGQLLQSMFDKHQPKNWYFGHHHKAWQGELFGTKFRCLDCFETVKI